MSSKTEGIAPEQIWQEFLNYVRLGKIPLEKCEPIDPSFREVLAGFVRSIQTNFLLEMEKTTPEVFLVENKVHFLLPLGEDHRNYTFSFLSDGHDWKFHQVESIHLDFRPPLKLPQNTFPDLPADQKAWIIAEFQGTDQIRLFNFLADEKGKEFAYHWFQDGAGYVLAASVWIPFFPTPQAFILYLCWEQANLRGSQVTLLSLDDHNALVDLKPSFLELYQQTGHLKTMISYEDYRQLFETIWLDRAKNAGWAVQFSYLGEVCQMKFSK